MDEFYKITKGLLQDASSIVFKLFKCPWVSSDPSWLSPSQHNTLEITLEKHYQFWLALWWLHIHVFFIEIGRSFKRKFCRGKSDTSDSLFTIHGFSHIQHHLWSLLVFLVVSSSKKCKSWHGCSSLTCNFINVTLCFFVIDLSKETLRETRYKHVSILLHVRNFLSLMDVVMIKKSWLDVYLFISSRALMKLTEVATRKWQHILPQRRSSR